MTVRILLLSFYYPPDLAAGSFRVEALVRALLEQNNCKLHIDLITTQPNRYHSYKAPAESTQGFSRLSITRIDLPPHKNGVVDQAKAFLSYALGARKAARGKNYDLVVASSSRLMTAALGASISFQSKTPLYLDIRDIFVETLPELYPGMVGRTMTYFFSWVERLTIRQATQVNLISPGFLGYFNERYPHRYFSTHTNGVDDLFLQPLTNLEKLRAPSTELKIVYAGNIGAGQGLDRIIPAMAEQLEGLAQFYIIGDGGAADKLRQALASKNISNVKLIAPTKRSNLIDHYREADILFLHLNTFKSFRRVLPSKLFEYAATGKPILAGLGGYARQFTKSKIANATVFEPGDLNGAMEALNRLELTSINRSVFVEDYSRVAIQQRMALDVLGTPELSNGPSTRYLRLKRWIFIQIDWIGAGSRYPVVAEVLTASFLG
ncbi:glycosyltransferase family 4 protein [Pseudomonas sp. MF6768]|jgi:glycosyltransferase involved in cell wall biosynthesis|uniref:glycosyltransferase family 4 protein n=1 Tax=Pseudomonas sp. MF6768 TaxID=2797532 RepID=UPI0018E7B85C|nr:glycosyltransferase family 4 protein [Pseudomonas sp. MF6768]MBJ2240679.1 glycosyltransferase family 4 protein [Pseudomonas sp. MF6768]